MNYETILQKIRPSDEEQKHVREKTANVVQKLLDGAKKNNYFIDVQPGGSTAKNTYLKGDYDIDIFVRFKISDAEAKYFSLKKHSSTLSDYLEKILQTAKIPATRIHGSRDYFQYEDGELFFEFVPVKYVESKEEVENITDMSPLHVRWVNENIGNLSSDIRLAKQFCKANGVYGAESYINGISGHVLDILVIHYGGFEEFIKAVVGWKKPVVVDHLKKHKDVFKELNEAKLQSPLIVIDPIDDSRNAAAALSEEKFYLLILSAKKFLEQPNEDFFTIIPFSQEKIQQEFEETKKLKPDAQLFFFSLQPLDGAKDVVGTKILKIYEFMKREIDEHDFTIYFSGWNFATKESAIYFVVDGKELDKEYTKRGPPTKATTGAERFKEKHGDVVFEKDNYLYATIEREYILVKEFLVELLKNTYISSRAKSIQMRV